mgnify:CR=1 FL=1
MLQSPSKFDKTTNTWIWTYTDEEEEEAFEEEEVEEEIPEKLNVWPWMCKYKFVLEGYSLEDKVIAYQAHLDAHYMALERQKKRRMAKAFYIRNTLISSGLDMDRSVVQRG